MKLYKSYRTRREFIRQYNHQKGWLFLLDICKSLKKNQEKIEKNVSLLDEYQGQLISKLSSIRIKNHKTLDILQNNINFMKKTRKIRFGTDQIYCATIKNVKIDCL